MSIVSAELISVGDELVLVIDKSLKERYALAPGSPVEIISRDGVLVLTLPVRPETSDTASARFTAADAAREGMEQNASMLQRLAE